MTQSNWGYGWSARAFVALVFMGLVAAFPWFEATRNANEVPRMMQARAVVEDGRWDLQSAASKGIPAGPDVSSGVDNRMYPNKPPGTTLVLGAAYVTAKGVDAALGRDLTWRDYGWWSRFFAGILPTLFVCGYALRRYREDIGAAGASAGLYLWVFGTPAFAYAHVAYGHQLAAALMFFGICKLADGHRQENYNDTLWGALAAGAAVGVEYGAVFAGIPIAVMLLLGIRDGDRGLLRALVGLAGALIPISALAMYQRSAFGSLWSTGYQHALNAGFAEKHSQGLLGLGMPSWERFSVDWLAWDTGLLVLAPIVLVGVFGLVQLARSTHQRCTEARLFLATFLIMALVGAGLSFEGGWRVGPRYLVFTLPGLVLGIAYVFNQVRMSVVALSVLMSVGMYSVIVNVLAGTLWPHIDATNLHSPVVELLWPLLKSGVHPYSPFDLLGWDYAWVLSFGFPVAGLILILAYGSDFSVLLGWALVMALFGSLTALVAVDKAAGVHPRAGANLDYVRSVYEPSQDDERRPGSTLRLKAAR